MPPAALLTILQKGLQYTEAEISIGEDGEFNKKQQFTCFKKVKIDLKYLFLMNRRYCESFDRRLEFD